MDKEHGLNTSDGFKMVEIVGKKSENEGHDLEEPFDEKFWQEVCFDSYEITFCSTSYPSQNAIVL